MKNILLCIPVIIIIFIATFCKINNKEPSNINKLFVENDLSVEIGGKTYKNTTKPIDILITKVVNLDELNTNINYLAENDLIECIRINKKNFYIVLKTSNEKYAIFLYDISTPKFPIDKWVVSNISIETFDKIIVDKTTLDELMKLDPDGNYESVLYASALPSFSFHHTIDGYLIIVKYSLIDSEKIISEIISNIEIISPIDNDIYKSLTLDDKKFLTTNVK